MKERAHRYVRRLEVTCHEKGGETTFTGYTLNISSTGMFIACLRPLPLKTRVQVEIKAREASVWLEAVVTRQLRVRPELQRVKPGGIGVRFLSVEELVHELIPSREKTVPPAPAQEAVEEPSRAPGADADTGTSVTLRTELRRRGEVLLIVSQEIREGGMFIRTDRDIAVGARARIEVTLTGSKAPPAVLTGTVTERVAPDADPDGGSNLVAGVSIQLDDTDAAETALMKLMSQDLGG